MVGQPIEKNPMRLDLEESGQMLKETGLYHQCRTEQPVWKLSGWSAEMQLPLIAKAPK